MSRPLTEVLTADWRNEFGAWFCAPCGGLLPAARQPVQGRTYVPRCQCPRRRLK